MILKTLTHDRGESDCWNYYDNIEYMSAFYNADIKQTCVSLKFKNNENFITLCLNEIAYICNDEGKTIEVLKHFTQKNKYNKKIEERATD